MIKIFVPIILIIFMVSAGALKAQDVQAVTSWESASLLPGLSPSFDKKGASNNGSFILSIETDSHNNLHGYWKNKFPVEGSAFYSFSVDKKVDNIEDVRRATPVNIHWLNSSGETVLRDKVYTDKRYALETVDDPNDTWAWTARPEIPYKEKILKDGQIRVSSVFEAPSNATHIEVELHMRWSADASVEWSNIHLEKIEAPAKQKVKIATVFLPINKGPKVETAEQTVGIFTPYIEEAADKGVKLICLPEVLTKKFTKGLSNEQVAEEIPGGGATQAFISLAQKHDIYIVAGVVERDQDTLYNTSILVGPEGYVGKYRKVVLTLAEANAAGLTPGTGYPVFDTKIGKIGMMICYDLYFPEVARELSRNGAQIIAMPIAGGHPILAQARAIENQVYLVTSTYAVRKPWIKTAIYDYDGEMLDFAEKPGSMAIAEVEISDLPRYWVHLGDLKADIFIQEPKK